MIRVLKLLVLSSLAGLVWLHSSGLRRHLDQLGNQLFHESSWPQDQVSALANTVRAHYEEEAPEAWDVHVLPTSIDRFPIIDAPQRRNAVQTLGSYKPPEGSRLWAPSGTLIWRDYMHFLSRLGRSQESERDRDQQTGTFWLELAELLETTDNATLREAGEATLALREDVRGLRAKYRTHLVDEDEVTRALDELILFDKDIVPEGLDPYFVGSEPPSDPEHAWTRGESQFLEPIEVFNCRGKLFWNVNGVESPGSSGQIRVLHEIQRVELRRAWLDTLLLDKVSKSDHYPGLRREFFGDGGSLGLIPEHLIVQSARRVLFFSDTSPPPDLEAAITSNQCCRYQCLDGSDHGRLDPDSMRVAEDGSSFNGRDANSQPQLVAVVSRRYPR